MLSVQKSNLDLMERVGSLKCENNRLKSLLNEHGINFKPSHSLNNSAEIPPSDPTEESDSQQLPLLNKALETNISNQASSNSPNNLVNEENNRQQI